ncbi:MAG: ABC transporter permease subunit [Candidatus Micrarchaeaceae archaeon]
MHAQRVLLLAEKDLREAFSSIEIYGPMLGIPLFFAFLLPAFTVYVSQYAGVQIAERILGPVAVSQAPQINKLAFIEYFTENVLGPIFMIMPIITASVLAADSFAGEKERKTSEALLSSPISNAELFMGKILASALPAFLITLSVFLIYAGIINYFTVGEYGVSVFPNATWYLMLANSPLLILATIGLVVLVSSKVKGIKEAQQVSALLALPIFLMPFVAIFNVFSFSTAFFAYLLAFLFAVALLILFIGIRSFSRESMIST